jgi:hypothetical protein
MKCYEFIEYYGARPEYFRTKAEAKRRGMEVHPQMRPNLFIRCLYLAITQDRMRAAMNGTFYTFMRKDASNALMPYCWKVLGMTTRGAFVNITPDDGVGTRGVGNDTFQWLTNMRPRKDEPEE